jgi:hypothetical protein
MRHAGVFWPVVSVLLLLVAACSSGDNGTSTVPAPATSDTPPPTETVVDVSDPMSGELDLSYLPDDPTELMMASLEEPLDRVARKMAYSGDQTYIPVLLEYLRFQAQEEGIINMTSFLSRLKDNVPPEELMLFSQEQTEWKWWIEWLGNNPQVQPPDGYVGWKGQLYSILDPGLGAFLYDGVKTDIRIEEIVWGGVPKDGIPDLIDPPVIPASQASQADYLFPEDRVFGVSINGQHRAYPLRIMNRHEMANDVIAGVSFPLAY